MDRLPTEVLTKTKINIQKQMLIDPSENKLKTKNYTLGLVL